MSDLETRDPSTGAEPKEESALKPLIYILIVPAIFIAVLQWSGLPAIVVHAATGN